MNETLDELTAKADGALLRAKKSRATSGSSTASG